MTLEKYGQHETLKSYFGRKVLQEDQEALRHAKEKELHHKQMAFCFNLERQ